jgi:hypothetical protein
VPIRKQEEDDMSHDADHGDESHLRPASPAWADRVAPGGPVMRDGRFGGSMTRSGPADREPVAAPAPATRDRLTIIGRRLAGGHYDSPAVIAALAIRLRDSGDL